MVEEFDYNSSECTTERFEGSGSGQIRMEKVYQWATKSQHGLDGI